MIIDIKCPGCGLDVRTTTDLYRIGHKPPLCKLFIEGSFEDLQKALEKTMNEQRTAR